MASCLVGMVALYFVTETVGCSLRGRQIPGLPRVAVPVPATAPATATATGGGRFTRVPDREVVKAHSDRDPD
jgi:hypothetical protein